jgi:signal peptidase I
MAKKQKEAEMKGGAKVAGQSEEKPTTKNKVVREIISWAWVIAAFLFIQSTLVQARVIPSGSMENTLLIGDHLIVSRMGYDVEVPFTKYHWSLWREPKRQQIIVFRMPKQPDFIKRVIGLPGDHVEIKQGAVWINGKVLTEPYVTNVMDPHGRYTFEDVVVPPGCYFMMGDNRTNSHDSRYWGFVRREQIIGTPVLTYMSVEANPDAWQPGHIGERFLAYATALVKPRLVRWKRLFVTF